MDERLRAIIYTAAAGDIEAANRCLDHCRRQNYRFIDVITNDYDGAERMAIKGDADVIVVDRRSATPASRLPRIEVVAEFQPGRPEPRPNGSPLAARQRRARRV